MIIGIITVSNDSINWRKIIDKKDYINPKGKPQIFIVNNEYARYIKVEGTNVDNYYYSDGNDKKIRNICFTEIEAYGVKIKDSL